MDEFIADDLIFFIKGHAGDIAFGHFEVTSAFGFRTKHGAGLAAKAFAEVIEAGANRKTTFRECRLRAAVYDLEEKAGA